MHTLGTAGSAACLATIAGLALVVTACGSAQSRREVLEEAAIALVDVITCGEDTASTRRRRRAERRARRRQSANPQGPPVPVDDDPLLVDPVCRSARNRNPDAGERQRRRRAMRRARRRRGPPPATPPPSLEEQGRLNEPGTAPTRDGLTRAFHLIEPELRHCAASGAGRLLVEGILDGEAGLVDSYQLFGEASAQVDEACIGDALAGLRFDPFPESLEVYWALLY